MSELEPVPTHPFAIQGMRERWETGHNIIDRLASQDLSTAGLDSDAAFFAESRRTASHARLDDMLGISPQIWKAHVEMGGAMTSPKLKFLLESASDVVSDSKARRLRSTFELITNDDVESAEGDN
jgi:hypothetical protein